NADLACFFYGAGIPVYEGYGLTEAGPVVACNTPDRNQVGSVGIPLPQVSVRIADDGEVLFRAARGMADLELGVPIEPAHVFRLGSITKQFTAAAILLLEAEGKLAVDAEITDYLPDYPTHGHRITVDHLLQHTSGIASYTSIPGYMMGSEIRTDLTTEELVDVFDDRAMDFAPGERWQYNNSGYVLLGAIVEAVSGMTYADFVQQHIFEPLGMENSHYGGSQLVPGRVAGYSGTGGDYSNAPFLSMTQPHAAGSLLSTVDDLARWNAGLFGGRLLETEAVERMTRETVLNGGDTHPYGYGLALSEVRGQRAIGHGGGIFGFSTYAMWVPDSKVFVAVLSNHPGNETRPSYLAYQLAALALGDPFPEREALELPAEELEDFVGVYRIDDATTRAVTLEEGQLYTQRTGGPRFPIFPHGDDDFFYRQSFTHLSFERDAEGRVAAMHMYPDGASEAEICPRIEEAPDSAAGGAGREVAEVSPELYDLWAGTYEVGPGFHLTIRREGDRLISQATGQAPFELFPTSTTR
ncbi:MAG: serine hydrolase, partial [Holophagales bacterium]|nr:serine hydrolase [Holophagales bacterium]